MLLKAMLHSASEILHYAKCMMILHYDYLHPINYHTKTIAHLRGMKISDVKKWHKLLPIICVLSPRGLYLPRS